MSYLLLISLIVIQISIILSGKVSEFLECSVDQTQLTNIINGLKSKGYTVEKQSILSTGGNSNELAPNKGGAYGSILRNNVSYDIPESLPGLTFTYKMGADTAVLFHGCTPPKVEYFGYKTYLWRNDENVWIWGALGNVINNNVIKTYNQFNQYISPPFDDLTTIISTADNDTYYDIINIYQQYGINENMINLDHIPSDIITMGTDEDATFHTLYRVNLPSNIDAFNAYFNNINNDDFINVYFITKGNETIQDIPENPIPTPSVKNRVCTDSSYYNNGNEYYLESKYEGLKDKLNDVMKEEFNYQNEKTRKIIGAEYDALQCAEDNTLCAGNSPDCLYYEDYNNQTFFIKTPDGNNNMLNRNINGYILNDDNLFIIMGVNHYNLGLAAFNQETIYDETYTAIDSEGTTMNNFEYNNSANYFNDNDNEYNEFYMIMYVRPGNCIQNMIDSGVKCVQIPYDKLDINTGFIVFSRAYLNPCTNTGPSKDEFLYEYLLEYRFVSVDGSDGSNRWKLLVIILIQMSIYFPFF